MITSGLILMIKESAAKGKNAYVISQEIGMSKNAARKYMKQGHATSCHNSFITGIRQLRLLYYPQGLQSSSSLVCCVTSGTLPSGPFL